MARWTDEQLTEAVAAARSYSDVLRWFGLRTAGGNHRLVRKHIERLGLSTDHWTFDPRPRTPRVVPPLEAVLVKGSTYKRSSLKKRLYEEGLKERRCELCGQGELWRGLPMSLILDHVNGVHDDNRLENLRIVCPNCNATFDTHCGRKHSRDDRVCELCGEHFTPTTDRQRYCSRRCGVRHPSGRAGPRPGARKVVRPPLEQLLAEVEAEGWSAVGRRYGVSDNAVRKWVRTEHARATQETGPGASTTGQAPQP